jgi:TonB family protein
MRRIAGFCFGLASVVATPQVVCAQAQTRDTSKAQQATTEPTYFEFQVTTPARHAPGSTAPRYPPELKAAGVEGEVLVQFVVDTLGLPVLQTFRVLKSSHGEFTESVKTALPDMKFVPAELRGRKVRQLVQQPFVFAIQKKDSTAATAAAVRTPTPWPALFPSSVTPAPRSGTVRGWTIVQRLTTDSGNGSAAVSTNTRLFGTAGRIRVEIEGFPMGAMVTLVDSATGRTTLLLPSQKSANVVKTQGRDDAQITTRYRSSPPGIEDLGAGETIAGLPTRHYRVTGASALRFKLGAQACVITRPTVMEYWTTTDPMYAAMRRQSRWWGTAMLGPSSNPLTAADSSDPSMLGPHLKVVAHDVGPVRDRKGVVTMTSEILSFSDTTLAASLFEAPEGYQLRDLTSVVSPVHLDSLQTAITKKVFEQWVDTTKVVPGVTTSCTAARAP